MRSIAARRQLRIVRLVVFGGAVTLVAGCAHHAPPPLYLWGNFPRMQYDALLKDGVSPTEQIAPMEAQVKRAHDGRVALPPGFRAHLGMLKLASGDPGQARILWMAEKDAFPESTPYMDQLLTRLAPPEKKDSE